MSRLQIKEAQTITIVQFDRPAERNPLTSDTLDEFDQVLDSVDSNSEIQALIITGSDDVFLSGANIRELLELDQPAAAAFSHRGQAIMQKLARMNAVTIAAINGYCMGGGLDLALACDIRVASRDAVFAHPGARLGIITGWGGTQRLPRLVGKSKAIDLFATARRIDSGEALRIGLITSVFDNVLTDSITLAKNIIATSSRIAQFPADSRQSTAP